MISSPPLTSPRIRFASLILVLQHGSEHRARVPWTVSECTWHTVGGRMWVEYWITLSAHRTEQTHNIKYIEGSGKMFSSQIKVQIPSPPLIGGCPWATYWTFLSLRSHLWDEDNNTSFIEVLGRLEIIYSKHLSWHLAWQKHSINGSSSFNEYSLTCG